MFTPQTRILQTPNFIMYDVSIIMVVYDGDDTKHFEEALVSLYPNNNFYNELVLVINGEISKKKKKIIEKLKDDLKIKPIFLKTNIHFLPRVINRLFQIERSNLVTTH